MKIFSNNKKAQFDYFLEKLYITGLELKGSEVKTVRSNKMSLKESYVKIINSEVFLLNANIPMSNSITAFAKNSYDEKRPKKLLLTKKEINYLIGAVSQDGYTLVCTKVFQPDNSKLIKCEIALAKGKKLYDKRESIKERDLQRELRYSE